MLRATTRSIPERVYRAAPKASVRQLSSQTKRDGAPSARYFIASASAGAAAAAAAMTLYYSRNPVQNEVAPPGPVSPPKAALRGTRSTVTSGQLNTLVWGSNKYV